MIMIGELSLWVALLMAAWSTTVSFAGGTLQRDDLIESGVRGLYATFVMMLLASVGLWTALLSKDFSLQYVAGHVGTNTPGLYAFAAFWSGQAGAILFWALILSMFGSTAVATSRSKNRELIPWVTGTVSAILFFLVVMACLEANPFTRLPATPIDGSGMDAQLQNPGMAIHPATLYLGFVATAIPFAFTIAALCARQLDAEWVRVVRGWTLLTWFFLTIGILVSMWWAYVELGSGVYWAWRAVENLSLLPWLITTACLHSIVVQEKRGRLRRWNVVLVVISFLFAILGTVITRGGRIETVHSFMQSTSGPWFATFFSLATGLTIYLVGSRLHSLDDKGERDGAVNREAIEVGPRLGHSRRRYGGHIVHAGIVLLVAAFAGMAFKSEHDVTLKTGETFDVTDPYARHWRFVSQGVSTSSRPDHDVMAVGLDAFVDGQRVGIISSGMRQNLDSQKNASFQPITEIGIRSTAKLDTYVVLDSVRGNDTVTLRIMFIPLVVWVWTGGLMMMFGGLIVMWPRADR